MPPNQIVMGPQGPIPTPPATLRQMLTDLVQRTNPGYLNNLPSSLVEDIASTDVGALIISNQYFIDLINSVTPYGANAFLLYQLGIEIYGISPSSATNTSVDLIFSGTPGFIIIPGFTVSDGNHQYVCADGGVVGQFGESLPVHAIANVPGTWAVPVGSVTQFITAVPANIRLSVINPADGIPSLSTETIQSFRTRTLTAGLAASVGMDRYLKTLLWNVPGVVHRLVSVIQNDNCTWTIIVGGGDPYQVAWAIYRAVADLPSLARPPILIDNISNTNPIVVTTASNHNLLDGMEEYFENIVGMETLNNNWYEITVIDAQNFSIPLNGTIMLPYQGGGEITPNPILQTIMLNSFPDNYSIPFIIPAQELVTLVVTWDTDDQQYVSPQAISQAAQPALIDYINSLFVGKQPINTYEMTTVFLEAVASILASENITVLTFQVAFDGVGHLPDEDTGVISGDLYSYFYTTTTNVIILQQ